MNDDRQAINRVLRYWAIGVAAFLSLVMVLGFFGLLPQ